MPRVQIHGDFLGEVDLFIYRSTLRGSAAVGCAHGTRDDRAAARARRGAGVRGDAGRLDAGQQWRARFSSPTANRPDNSR